MAGRFIWRRFDEIDLSDAFFDPLKADYPEFVEWFGRKAREQQSALTYVDDEGVGAFVYFKEENEAIALQERTLAAMPRLKIGTLRLAERIRNMRLGEGAIGVCLWKWRDLGYQQVYVTVFEKQIQLISILIKFGFKLVGHKANGECVYVKDKDNMDTSSVYGTFPYLIQPYTYAGILPIMAEFHDKLFPYSELHGVSYAQAVEDAAGNGITKVYIATPSSELSYYEGEPVVFYRIATENKTYKSVATSYGRIRRVTRVRDVSNEFISMEEYLTCVGNKSIFSEAQLKSFYYSNRNVYVIELVYCGFFGAGNNVTHHDMKQAGLFESYPYHIRYDTQKFNKLLEMGGINVQGAFINKS